MAARRRGKPNTRREVRDRDQAAAKQALRNLARAQRIELEAEGYLLVARRAKYDAAARAFDAGCTGVEVGKVSGVNAGTAARWRRLLSR